MLALLLVAVIAQGAAAAAPIAAGLSEQDPGLLSDFRIRALPLDHARLVVPWDVALTDPARVDRWLAAVRVGRMEPLIAFEHAATDRCPDTPCTLPSDAEYRAALAAFRLRWPAVREWTPWNEPNHPSQPTAGAPARAAAYYDAAADVCPACTLVAADLVDSASMKGYLRDYRAALITAPAVWGIHDYGDVTYPRAPYTRWLLDQVAGVVWITETGGLVRLTSGAEDLLPYDEQRAADSIDKAFALVSASPRITRMYFYNWRAAPWEPFDAGLTAPDGAWRPALERLFAHLGTRPPVSDEPATVPAAVLTPAGTGVRPVTGSEVASPIATATIELGRFPARLTAVRLARDGLRVRLSCPGRRRCAGHLLVDAVDGRGRPRRHLGDAAILAAAGGSWIRVRVARARLRPRGTGIRRPIRIVAHLSSPSAVTVIRVTVRVPFR